MRRGGSGLRFLSLLFPPGNTSIRQWVITFLAVFLVIIPSVYIGREVVAPAVYQAELEELDLDTSPGSVGSPWDGGVPAVTEAAEMKEGERFALQVLETRRLGGGGDSHAGGFLGGAYYAAVTLNDGTVMAIRYNIPAKTSELIPGEDYYAKEHHVLVTYPVGTLRPWPDEAAQADAEAADWLTWRLGWLDAEGDFGAEPPNEKGIRARCTGAAAAAGVLLGIALCMALDGLLKRRDCRAAMPKNDLERWILGTYANFAVYYSTMERQGRRKWLYRRFLGYYRPGGPLLLGGRPRDEESRQMTRESLKQSWGVKNLRELLDAVAYMSAGAGFAGCRDQAERAWQLCRSTQLLGLAYTAGWLSREEMAERSCAVGKTIQTVFRDWNELNDCYQAGYERWAVRAKVPREVILLRRRIRQDLEKRRDSPCRLPWLLPLDPDCWARRAGQERDLG